MEAHLKRILWDPLENKIAALLGLDLKEYLQLRHSELRAIKDTNGAILKYYMVFGAINPEHILRKLKLHKFGMFYFPFDAFEWKDVPADESY